MVQFDADTSASGVAIIAAIILILYKKRKDMRGTALIDASPTILMDTSIYDLTAADTPASVKENMRKLVSLSCFSVMLGLDFCLSPFLLDSPQCCFSAIVCSA